jgi:hypothetical protein
VDLAPHPPRIDPGAEGGADDELPGPAIRAQQQAVEAVEPVERLLAGGEVLGPVVADDLAG